MLGTWTKIFLFDYNFSTNKLYLICIFMYSYNNMNYYRYNYFRILKYTFIDFYL